MASSERVMRYFGVALLTSCAVAVGGCNSIILPGHPESYDIEGEQFTIRMLCREDVEQKGDLKADWNAAFGSLYASCGDGSRSTQDPFEMASSFQWQDSRSSERFVGPALVAGAAGLAIDLVKKQLEDEATRYEAQFGTRVAKDGFFIRDGDSGPWRQQYYGFIVERATKRHPAHDGLDPIGPSETLPAFRMVCGIAPSADQSMFLIAPLRIAIGSSKAKVFQLRWWSALPPFWWHILPDFGSEVETSVEFEIEAQWVRKDDMIGRAVAAVPVNIGLKSLTDPKEWRAKDEEPTKARDLVYGWFQAVPRSDPISEGTKYRQSGTFKISARVTQKDPSNAKKYLEKGAEYLAENREHWVSAVSGGTNKAPLAVPATRLPSGPSEWTVMVFMNGDNNLETDAIKDFMEMSAATNDPNINVLVQLDRIPGGSAAYGDWTNCKRFEIVHGCTPSPLDPCCLGDVEQAGERDANMGDPAVLRAFVDWAKARRPAKHYMLVVWDHGQGWRLIEEAAARAALAEARPVVEVRNSTYRSISVDDTNQDKLYNRELQDGLAGAGLDVVGFDACLMSMVETAYALRGVGKVMVASEELEPGTGWNYRDVLERLSAAPQSDGREVGRMIVESYRQTYHGADERCTLSATDLSKAASLAQSVSDLAEALRPAVATKLLAGIKAARGQCDEYAPDYPGYFHHVDLWRLCDQLATSATGDIASRAARVKSLVDDSVLANYAGDDRLGRFGSRGIAIYFPATGTAYRTDGYAEGGYEQNNKLFPVAFVQDFEWDEFLHDFYKYVP